MQEIKIYKNSIISKIKPMNAVNNLPHFINEKYDKYIKNLGIPYVRLHDSFIMNPRLVDIPAIFPNFDAEAEDPNSYDFAFTDNYIKKIISFDSQPFYRLGVSIENFRYIKAYNIIPPKDNLKWAKICEHIIAHYNKGWNNGFHYNIKYWEIWNEPDNYPDIKDNQMWAGTFEEYLKLYEVSANYLKEKFPEIKIGGYSSCGFYEILKQKSAEEAHISSRTNYFIECFEKFLKFISSKEHNSPLDFFSWHSYSNVDSNIKYTKYVRQMLNKYGFNNTENILNEWNPSVKERGTLKDASNICANMVSLQAVGLDMLMYYDLRFNTDYCGVFNTVTHKPFKAYYVFKYFNEVALYKNVVDISINGNYLYGIATYNGKKGMLLLTNNSDEKKQVIITGLNNIIEARFLSNKKREKNSVKDCFTLFPYDVMAVLYE